MPNSGAKKLKASQIKTLAAIYELSLDGVSPSMKGLVSFLTGEDSSSAYESLWCYGIYSSLSKRRLGSILNHLQDARLIRVLEQDGERYFLCSEFGLEAAKAFLSQDHKKTETHRKAPLFISIYRKDNR